MWIFSVVTAAAAALATAFLNGYEGTAYLLLLPLFAGYLVAVILFCFVFAFFATLPINLDKPVTKPSRFYTFLYHFIDDFLCETARIDLKINGLEKLDPKQKYLFVYNHRSDFDPMLMSKFFKRYKILMVSKPSNFRIPIAGKCIHKAGFMPIDRENDREAMKTVLKAAEYLKNGYSIGIAPEGTRNKKGIGLLPFRNGAFKIAQRAAAPIAVFTFNGVEKVGRNFPFKRTKATLDIVRVYSAEEACALRTAELGEEVACAMLDDIRERNPGFKVNAEKDEKQ